MIVLDTDALGHLQKSDRVGALIQTHLDDSPDRDFRITVISTYEMLGGALALIDQWKSHHGNLIPAFSLLQDLVDYLGRWRGLILPWDAAGQQIYQAFQPRLRQGLKDDARIAAIAIESDAAVWTCNVADYARVPGLTVVRAETGARVS